jgi:hypothetical protein
MLKLVPEDRFLLLSTSNAVSDACVSVCSALRGEENKLCKTLYCTLIFVHDLYITRIWVN